MYWYSVGNILTGTRLAELSLVSYDDVNSNVLEIIFG